jgi:hypothetical protein
MGEQHLMDFCTFRAILGPMFLKVTHPGIYDNYDLKKFFCMEEDHRRQAKAAVLIQQSNAIAQGIAMPPSPLNYYTRRSADFKALCIDYQNDLYVTRVTFAFCPMLQWY